jgi:hypothetical protein
LQGLYLGEGLVRAEDEGKLLGTLAVLHKAVLVGHKVTARTVDSILLARSESWDGQRGHGDMARMTYP